MALSITQQAALLFKKLFGKAQTTTARDFFEEPFNAPPTVLTSQIWTDSAQIPLTASVSFTGSGHIIGVVQYLQDVSLTLVAGTSNSFQDNQLRDAIPFNYGNGSYNYAIKDSTSTAIPFGTNDWIVDTEGGVLTFYNSVPANMPPTITFYKYVGNKGLASASVNLANSASYAVTASYASNAGATNFSTGSYTGSFTGSLLGSSSYALSSSWAARSVSASYAGTDWNAINNKPTVISSSVQINTGSFTGSFTGSLLGSSSYALSSSWAARSVSASYAGTDWNAINNKPTVFSSSVQINTGSYTGSFTGSLLGSASYALTASAATSITFTPTSASYALSSSFAQSSSFAVSASWSPGSAGGDFNTLVNKPTLVSSSAQVNTGSFTGSFTGGFAGTASYALNAATASYISSSVDFPNGLTVTGSITASVGFSGSGANITGVVSSSYALTASYAMNGGGSGVSSSYALTSSYASYAPTALSASFATSALTASYMTGSINFTDGLLVTGSVTASIGYTGSFTGSLLGSSSYALSSSYAMSASWAPGSAGGDFNTLVNKPTLVSSSAQINTGSFTGSFIGEHVGSSSWASQSISSSYARSASYAGTDWNAINNKPVIISASAQINTGSFTGSFTGGFAGTASYAFTSWADVNNKPIGILSSSAQINLLTNVSASWASRSISASYAGTDWNAINNRPVVVSSSAQVSTGSYTGSFTGGLLGSASYAPTSWVNINNKPDGILSGSTQINLLSGVSSSWASQSLSSSYAFSSSYAVSASWAPGSAGGDFNTLVNKPTLVSSSAQVNTGSFTGSFTGNLLGSASYATTASYVGGSIASASYAQFATSASYFTGSLTFPAGLIVTGSVTASAYTGSFTGSLLGSASYALSASWAPGGGAADFNTLLNKPTLVSSSAQVNTGSFTGSFIGDHIGSSSWASHSISSSYARSASYAGTDWNAINNKPIIVSSSAQVNTGSFTGSFTGNFLGSASFATTSSYATSTTWNSVNNKPTVVSASAQINTGSFTGSFTGGLLGSASYAPTSWVDVNNKPVGILSGSTQINLLSGVSASWASQSLSSSYAFSSSYAVSASWAPVSAGSDFNTLVNKPTLVSSSAQVNTGSFTGSFTGGLLGTASYANTAATASYITASIGFPNGLIVTGSVTASAYTGSLTGSLLGSASYALSASWAPGGLGVSASYAATASSANDFYVRGQLRSYGAVNDSTNTALGDNALVAQYLNPAGSHNTAIGNWALYSNVSGTDNTAVGHAAQLFNVSGSKNSALGQTALYSNVSGDENTAVGHEALYNSVIGYTNTAIGRGSLFANVSGSNNTAVGASVLGSLVEGSNNLAFGANALGLNVSGSNNLALGTQAGYYETGSETLYIDNRSRGSLYAQQTGSLIYGTFDLLPINQVLRINAHLSASYKMYVAGGITGSLLGSSSYAVSASWAPTSAGGDFNTLVNKPTLVSSSAQVNTGSFTGSFTGNFLGSASYATMALTASYMTGSLNFSDGLVVTGSVTASAYTGSFTGSLLGSSSYATMAATASYISGGLDLSSGLVVTGSVTASIGYTGSFTGSLLGSSSYALSSSYAMSASWAPGGAGGDFNTLINKPTLVSSSAQVNTGSFTGSFTGNFLGSASYATYAVTASYVSGGLNFPAGLVVTGSVSASQGFSGSLAGTASYAHTASALVSRHADVFTTPSIGDNITYTGSMDLGRTWMLLGIEADRAARVRMYATTGSRFTDGLRGIGIDPSASAGVLADFVFTAAGKLMVTPVIVGSNMEGIVSSSTPFLIENRSGGASTVTITFTNIKVE